MCTLTSFLYHIIKGKEDLNIRLADLLLTEDSKNLIKTKAKIIPSEIDSYETVTGSLLSNSITVPIM